LREPRSRIVARDVGKPFQAIVIASGSNRLRIVGAASTGIGGDSAEMREDRSEAFIGSLTVGLATHTCYCSHGTIALLAFDPS